MELSHQQAAMKYQQAASSHAHSFPQEWNQQLKREKRPYIISRDVSNLERNKPVTKILRSGSFRDKLENVFRTVAGGGIPPAVQRLQKNVTHASEIEKAIKLQGQPIPMQQGVHHIIQINDLVGVKYHDKYSIAEKQARCKLASLYRIIERKGWTLGIYNHVSLRAPGAEDHFLLNSFGLHYSEVTASNLVKVDLQGNVIDPGSTHFGISKAGYVIHSAIHEARKDIKCIIHLHTPHGAGLSAMMCGLLPLCQEALIVGGVSYHAYRGIACDVSEKVELARDLGPVNKVMILQNHGLLAMGGTVEEAYSICYNLMAACETQVMALSAGIANLMLVNKDTADEVFATVQGGGGGVSCHRRLKAGELEFEPLMRELDNLGYNTGYPYKLNDLLYPSSDTDWINDDSPIIDNGPNRGATPVGEEHHLDSHGGIGDGSPSAVSAIGKRIRQEIDRIKRERSKGRINMLKQQLQKEQVTSANNNYMEHDDNKVPVISEDGSIDLEQIALQSTGTCHPVYGTSTGIGLTTGSIGMDLNTGIGVNSGSTGMGLNSGSARMGLNTDSIRMGINTGNTGMGLNAGNTGMGINTGSTGMGLQPMQPSYPPTGYQISSHTSTRVAPDETPLNDHSTDQYIEDGRRQTSGTPFTSATTPTTTAANIGGDGIWDFLDERKSHGPLPLNVTAPTITPHHQHNTEDTIPQQKSNNRAKGRNEADRRHLPSHPEQPELEYEVAIHPSYSNVPQSNEVLPDLRPSTDDVGHCNIPRSDLPGTLSWGEEHVIDSDDDEYKQYVKLKGQRDDPHTEEQQVPPHTIGRLTIGQQHQLHVNTFPHPLSKATQMKGHHHTHMQEQDPSMMEQYQPRPNSKEELHLHNEEPYVRYEGSTHQDDDDDNGRDRIVGVTNDEVTSSNLSGLHHVEGTRNPAHNYDGRNILAKVEETAKAVASSTDESVKKLSHLTHQQQHQRRSDGGETGHLLGNYPDKNTQLLPNESNPNHHQLVQSSVPVPTASTPPSGTTSDSTSSVYTSVPVPTASTPPSGGVDTTADDNSSTSSVYTSVPVLITSTPPSGTTADDNPSTSSVYTSVPVPSVSTPPSGTMADDNPSTSSVYIYSPPVLDSSLTGLNKALNTAKSVAKSTELSVEKLNKTNET